MKSSRFSLALAATALLSAQPWHGLQAQSPYFGAPTTWWPEPNSGLMWAGKLHPDLESMPANLSDGLSQQDAASYCAALTLADFAGWRLPTLDEAKAATEPGLEAVRYFRDQWETEQIRALYFKGRTVQGLPQECRYEFWTSTRDESGSYWAVTLDCQEPFTKQFANTRIPALCVRPMDPEMAALARNANVDVPIATMQDLQAYVALGKARVSFAAGQYSDSLQQALTALQLKPDFIPAIIGVGLSRCELGQWDQAANILQAARSKLDWNNSEIKAALKWAKDGQKAAAKGKQPKGKMPAWN